MGDKKLDHYHRRTSGEAPVVGDKPILLRLGDNVRKLRELHGWSQTELADKVGRAQIWVSYLERGVRDTKVGALPALARALRTSVQALLG